MPTKAGGGPDLYVRENICMENEVTLFLVVLSPRRQMSIDDEVYADYKTMIDMQTKTGQIWPDSSNRPNYVLSIKR